MVSIQMVSLTHTKSVKHIDKTKQTNKQANKKQNKNQNNWIVFNRFLITGSVLDVLCSGGQKPWRSTANIDAIRRTVLKSPEIYPSTFGRTQSEEINSAQHFAERL